MEKINYSGTTQSVYSLNNPIPRFSGNNSSMGMGLATPRVSSEIEQEIESINRNLTVLEVITSHLGKILDPISSSSFPEVAENNPKNPSRQSPIAKNLQSVDGILQYQISRLVSITSRIQL